MPRVAWLEGIDAVAQWVGARSSLGDDERLRLKFLIGGVGTGLATSALILVSMLVERVLFGGVFIFLFDGLMLAGVLALRRGWSGFRQVAMWELLLLLGFFVVMSLQTRTSRVEQLYWFALMPMGAALLLGRGAAAAGLLAGLSGVGAVVLLRRLGFTFDESPDTWLEEAANVVAFCLSVTVLSVLFETLRTRHAVEAERAAKARGLFLANVSHELRTPMNGVIGLTELLAGSQLDGEQRGHLDLLRRSGEAMVALINELLDLTKIEAGQFRLERAPVSVRALVGDVASLFASPARAKGVAIAAHVDPSVPPWILGDPLRLRQVLQNLVANAVKFTEHGEVRLSANWAEGVLELTVADDGVGMSPEVIGRLFQPFHQADETTTRRFGGTGLGLAITLQLARLMDGGVEVSSEPGRGSTFEVRVKAPLSAPPASTPTGAGGARLDRGRVLVVEDNPINQVVAKGLCERLGFEVEVAANGQEAVDAVQAGDFRLVLMDCQMPVMDGYEATQRIRGLAAPARSVPIVALTASAQREELDHCFVIGMNATLTKPLTSAALLEVLEHLGREGSKAQVRSPESPGPAALRTPSAR